MDVVGQATATKPSRSDEVLDADQQLRIANQIRAQFDSMVPKRPTKPNRSESDTSPSTLSNTERDLDIPELDKLRSLQSQSHVVFSTGENNTVQDEFVETEYYKELDSIDKQHYATGSGFIRAVREEDETGYGIHFQGSQSTVASQTVSGYKCNPATNDWTPNLEYDHGFVSSKPNRSESS